MADKQSELAKKGQYLVCVNDNDHSRIALKLAASKAKRRNCPLIIMHVLEPADYQSFEMVADKIRQERREEAEAMLQSFSELAQEWVGITPSLIFREGSVGEEIVATMDEDIRIDMLVLGTSRESPGRGNLLPWLASQLGKSLHVPMMIVPGDLTEQQIEDLA